MKDIEKFAVPIIDWLSTQAPQGVLITDAQLTVCGWNAWLELHSRISSADVMNKPLLELFPDLVQRGLNTLYRDALNGQVRIMSQRFHQYLLHMPTHSESGFDEMLQTAHISPLVDRDKVIGTVTIINDVTERTARERELRIARESAEDANLSKDRFIAMLSHDLRVPLNSVAGWVHLLKSRRDNPEIQDQALRSIEQNTLAQLRMIEDLLDSTRISSGKLNLDFEFSDLLAVINDACDALQPVAMAKNIQIKRSLPDQLLMVRIDARRIQQVVWNLVSNAVKFTSSGGAIDVRLKCLPGKVVLEVADTGIGLSPELLPHVFENMWQARQTADSKAGLGLGLTIVQKLVQLHGGIVRVESPGLGRGSTFIVELPEECVSRSA